MGELDVYKRLAREIDERYPVGYPPSASGVEIRLLKHLFTPEEAEIALHLSVVSEPIETIHKRMKGIDITIEELKMVLDGLSEKGAIMGGAVTRGKRGESRYALSSFILGMYDRQAGRLTEEYFRDSHEYLRTTFYKEMHRRDRTTQLRTIPVSKSITLEHHIGNYDNVKLLLTNTDGPLAIMGCVCKVGMDMLKRSCSVTDLRETCMFLGPNAEDFIKKGTAREVTSDELLELLNEFENHGLILQTENSQEPLFICACCGDCCQMLEHVKKFANPLEFFTTNYYVQIDQNLCSGCKTCIGRCQMEARDVVNDVSVVDSRRCIGCGLCVSTCPTSASELKKHGTETVPPKTTIKLLSRIMVEKVGFAKALKQLVLKYLSRQV